ncbi:MAG TPA: hypothetical protein VFE38_06350 [Edaphobacter sp.]|nr:hypothetical protein [Edaphobacter sp.]
MPSPSETPRSRERRRQLRGLLLLAALVLLFSLMRTHNPFPSGWWRLW